MELIRIENRDLECASDVARMAELNRFSKEFVIYGSACQEKNGEIYYYATSNEEKLYEFMNIQQLEQKIVTPIIKRRKKYKIPTDMEDEISQQIKYALLQYMKKQYEPEFFSFICPVSELRGNDNAVVLLEKYQKTIDGYFDDTELQLFEGLLQHSYKGKILTKQTYFQFIAWYDSVRKQMVDDPIVEDTIKRTFYGFAYLDETGNRKIFFDAQKMEVIHRQFVLLLQGFVVGTIIQKTYYFSQFNQMNRVRQNYREWLLHAQDETYFQALIWLNQQKGVIDFEFLQKGKVLLENKIDAYHAFLYYTKIWNRK